MRFVSAARFKNDQDATLIVHSLAGFPGTAAVSGLDKASRVTGGELTSPNVTKRPDHDALKI